MITRREIQEAAREVARQCEQQLAGCQEPIKVELLIQTAASWQTFARLIELGEFR